MTDAILTAITDHLREQYPQFHITQIEVPDGSKPNWDGHTGLVAALNGYTRIERPLKTKAWCSLPSPHCFLYHNDGILTVLNEHFQDTHIELANPESTTQLHDIIRRLLLLP